MNTNLLKDQFITSRSRFLHLLVICFSLTSLMSESVEAKQHKALKVHMKYHEKGKGFHFKPRPRNHTTHTPKPVPIVITSPGRTASANHVTTLAHYISHKYKRPSHVANNIAQAIHKASVRFNVDPYVIAAVAAKESEFKPTASNAGNYGLMQIDVSEHRAEIVAEGAVGKLSDPTYNVLVGSHILSSCLNEEAGGNIKHALSLYKRGCSAKHKNRKIREGSAYARHVLNEAQLAKNWSIDNNS